MLYRNLSGYLRERFGGRLDKICIDGGFTCPNRDGTVGVGGCLFCGERGAGEHIRASLSVREQVQAYLRRASDKAGYIAYFQNFTNTYAPLPILRQRYREALIDPRIRVLAIGTRPDCITAPIADLLAELDREVEVWVELGLQSAVDSTAQRIRRGYPTEMYDRAMQQLAARGLRTVTHVILGLPGEGRAELSQTVAYLNRFSHFGIKLHCLYVMEGTALAGL